ncbi:MAG: hypothetical protein CMG90_01990 [Marinobacter sp.]|nr:hypothetical protein [Marinobacter sp.]|tara:strand:- start:1465 stop:2424 length:960 start_codon:yes stop_codon:yes gene_type:complete
MKTEENPLVTVIIPAYNASEYISETLTSVINQTYKNIEIIVVDDGSTDNTKNIVQSFGKKVHYIYQENSGSCASPRNTGLRSAHGEYVTFLDADDIMVLSKIEDQVRGLKMHADAVISISNYWNFTETTKSSDHFSSCPLLRTLITKKQNESFKLEPDECRKILLEENFSIASSPIFPTTIIRSVGGFDETLKACEDFHLIYRVMMHGPAIISPYTGFYRRLHDSNMSSDNERMLMYLAQSRRSLIDEEFVSSLKNKLHIRVREYNRALQSCLLDNGKTERTIKLYRETFPPSNLNEFIHDTKQIIKFILLKIKIIDKN